MNRLSSLAAASVLALSPLSHAESGVQSLSPELRELLGKEMVALQEGMQSILPAYVSGDLKTVADIAQQMQDSFILKREITDAQKKELGKTLPKAFLALDKQFHEYAGMLAHVAQMQHTELVGFYYSKLTEACVSCHSDYATHRFPKLDKPSMTTHDKHHH